MCHEVLVAPRYSSWVDAGVIFEKELSLCLIISHPQEIAPIYSDSQSLANLDSIDKTFLGYYEEIDCHGLNDYPDLPRDLVVASAKRNKILYRLIWCSSR
ncbi:hypothetical protein RF11_05431 [Thelohanellus kitauei]|uniref:Uncharacterized protein n=1 Tax=Thelohanellus kitauei TaxID=669202 RepID=A0A0C2MVF8_THEKT|nr:hypothetical protein RF11_05431 [Thelohanellus kitauei]